MNMQKVWFITGAGRGMGAQLAKTALAAGYQVVATGRNTDHITKILGNEENLFVVKLDVTKPSDAETAVKAALDRFGRIDVLVNNAANFYGGFFEELALDKFESHLRTNLIGPMAVTQAVLPVMREQRSGHVISISSGAGISGFEFNSAYAASKFALEGWMESLAPELSPFNIYTTIVNPGFFRTEFLTEASAMYADPSITEYEERRAINMDMFHSQNGQQSGDPKKLADALLMIADEAQPPRRFVAGADAVGIAERKIVELRAQIDAYRNLSTSLSFHD